jgi:hypothetical protein
MVPRTDPERAALADAVLRTRKSAAPEPVLAERQGALRRDDEHVLWTWPPEPAKAEPDLAGLNHRPRCAPERPASADGHERCLR